MIDPDVFKPIIDEIERKPVEINKYRDVAGSGRSQAFGIVNRRCLPPDYSRQCWLRPYLYKLLLDFGNTYVKDISWNAITVNQNYKADKHRDKGNIGKSFLVAFGDYEGGDLKIYEGDLSGNHNIRYKPIITDFNKYYHSVESFTGNRYSLVYYNFYNTRLTVLPPPSVIYENKKYFFKRGDVIITQKNRLPHPLLNRKKKLDLENKNASFTVGFS